MVKIKNWYIVNESTIKKVTVLYLEPINYILLGLKDYLWNKIKSICVRWSVSIGKAVPFHSDMDIVCILCDQPTRKHLLRGKFFSTLIEKKYSFIKDMDLIIISYNDLIKWPSYNNLRNNLVTQSFCLFGEDILIKLPRKKVGRELCEYLYGDLSMQLKNMFDYIKQKNKKFYYLWRKKNLKFVCRWIMRTILRSAWWIVMLSKPFYSPNVKICFREFVKLYPEYSIIMKQILNREYSPIANRKNIIVFLNTFLPLYMSFYEEKLSCSWKLSAK